MNKKLSSIAILNFILIIPIAFYFKFFPTIISGIITNIIIFLLISAFIILLIYGTTMIGKDNKDYVYILPQSVIFIFLLSAIPNIRLEYPIIHDPYFYLVTTLNIIDYGTLQPMLSSWYPLIDQQLHWPVLELLTTNLVFLLNINPLHFMKFLVPLLGVVLFLLVFVLIKTVSNDNRISMLAALISSVSSLSIFINSEYHPQAIAPLFFILFIYFYYKFKNVNIIFGILMLLTILVFAMSHHFSSIFIGIFAIIYLITVFILTKFSFLDTKFLNLDNFIKDYNLWILIAVIMISYHFFVYFGFISGIVIDAFNSNSQISLITYGGNVPLYTTITNSMKWVVFLFALPAIYYSYKNRNKEQFQFAILFLCFILAGIIGSTIISMPLDRIIIFYYPFAAFFASITFLKLFNKKNGRSHIKIAVIVIISIILLAGVFGSQTPAYFFKNTEVNIYYWSSNDLSSASSFENTGSWINDYTNKSKFYALEFDTRSLAFYYGHAGPYIYYYQDGIPNTFKGYIVLNPSIPYNYLNFSKQNYLNNIDTFYSDGRVIVGGNGIR